MKTFFTNPRILAKTNGKMKMLKQNFIKPNINKRPNISNPLLASLDLKSLKKQQKCVRPEKCHRA